MWCKRYLVYSVELFCKPLLVAKRFGVEGACCSGFFTFVLAATRALIFYSSAYIQSVPLRTVSCVCV